MKNRSSRTADSSAAQRALHTLHACQPKIFEDRYALDLAGPTWRFLIGSRQMAWIFQRWFAWLMPMVAHHLARSRYVEEKLGSLLADGLTQYVLLGAGMDSFALRRTDLADRLSVFEIDHPATQAVKRRRLSRLGYPEPTNVTYVPVDFEVETLGDALVRNGFNTDRLTLFSWMGVIPYLTEESISATFRELAKIAAPGSVVLFDTLDRAAFAQGRQSLVGRKLFEATEKLGEPMLTGFDPDQIAQTLIEAGLSLVEVLTPEQFFEKWFSGRSDGLRPWAHIYVVCAQLRQPATTP